jgi:hypothetical protein
MTLAYATYFNAADVAAELKNINFTTNTNITAATLDDLCDRKQAILDGSIGLRYVLPITAAMPQSRLVLKEIGAKFTAAHVDEILRQNGIVINDNEKKKLEKLKSSAEDLLQAVMEDRTLLLDAVRKIPISHSISGGQHSRPVTQSLGINAISTGTSSIARLPAEIDINKVQW